LVTVGFDLVEYVPRLWNSDLGRMLIHIDKAPTDIAATVTDYMTASSNEPVFRFPAVLAGLAAAGRLSVAARPLAGAPATFVQVRTATLAWAPFNR
jgi:hypothetical protein